MKRYVKISLVIAASLASVVVVGAVALLLIIGNAFDGMCGNSPIAEYPSPNRSQHIVVFERNCGATTGFSTQASLLPSGVALPNEGGNLFIASGGTAPAGPGGGPELQVSWVSEKALVLARHPGAEVHLAAAELNGVVVKHVSIQQ
jgi:hypothetical protein